MSDKPNQQAQNMLPKLPKLPKNAKVTKRPLLRTTAIPSKYAGPTQQKVVYISTRTPFMSAVKRTERHLAQVEKREAQSATAIVKNDNRKKRKWGQYAGSGGGGDEGEAGEIGEIAKRLAEGKEKMLQGVGGEDGEWRKEEVVIRATGKAIQKALSVGLWFQSRQDAFGVLIKTGSVGAIDDVEIDESRSADARGDGGNNDDEDHAMRDAADHDKEEQDERKNSVPETRIRYASTIEIAVYKK